MKPVTVTVTTAPMRKDIQCNATYLDEPTDAKVNLNVVDVLLTTFEKSGFCTLTNAPEDMAPVVRAIELLLMILLLLKIMFVRRSVISVSVVILRLPLHH